MTARSMNPPGLHRPIGCYSQVTRIGSMVATAGMAAIGLDGKVVGEGDIRAQTRQTLTNLLAALAGVGAGPKDVLKITVYLSDYALYEGMNEAYREVFGDSPPARATLKADIVYPSLLVEMECLAVVES